MPRRKTQEEYEQQVQLKAPHVKVLGKYNGNRSPIQHYCMKHDVMWEVSPFNFLQHPTGCKSCQSEMLEKHHQSIKKSNEQFAEEVYALGTGIIPLCSYNGCHEQMTFKCKEGHIWNSTPHDILSGYGCPYCAGQRVLVGYNDLWTTNPEIATMLKNHEDGYTISRGSTQKVWWRCPDCGTLKYDFPKQVIGYGLACPMCSDGISYPEKLMANILQQLNISFEPQYSPEWIKPYRYDFLIRINGEYIIIEMDGGIGHGRIDFRTGSKDVNGFSRDVIKNESAAEHGLDLIRIDCDYHSINSRFEYIKESIYSSKLNEILNLSCVDWEKCNEQATRSLHIEAAKLYDGGKSISEISDELNISYSAIYNWLKRLAKEGLCSYKPVSGRPKVQNR